MKMFSIRYWLRRRLIRPLDRWLAVPVPRKYTLASRRQDRAVRQRLLRRLGRDLPLPSRALGSGT